MWFCRNDAEKVEFVEQQYRNYQKIKASRGTYVLDSYTMARTCKEDVRQIDIAATYWESQYAPHEKYSIIYYYENGEPYFALLNEKGSYNEFRFYIYEGEIVQDGNVKAEVPEEFAFIYEHAVSAYTLAMEKLGWS